MDGFDFVIIGAGPGGEAAAFEARSRGASVAVVDRDLFGGLVPALGLHPVQDVAPRSGAATPSVPTTSGRGTSARRDYMINRSRPGLPR